MKMWEREYEKGWSRYLGPDSPLQFESGCTKFSEYLLCA